MKNVSLLTIIIGVLITGWAIYSLATPSVVVKWSTATEFETAGYFVYRSENPEGPFEKITEVLIPAANDPLSGGDYTYTDRDVRPGTTYYYMLEEVELSGAANQEGPVVSTANRRGAFEGIVGIAIVLAGFVLRRSGPREPAPAAG